MTTERKTAGQLAYEEDVRRRATYDNGAQRSTWAQLDAVVRQSWERNPTPRDWAAPKGWAMAETAPENNSAIL